MLEKRIMFFFNFDLIIIVIILFQRSFGLEQELPSCGGSLTNKSGEIRKIGYEDNEYCEWRIEGHSKIDKIELNFTENFELENGYDFIYALDESQPEEHRLIFNLTGNFTNGRNFISKGSPIKITFKSDHSITRPGFIFKYKILEVQSSRQTIKIRNGTISKKNSFKNLVEIIQINGGYKYHFCGGSIINKKWILTAAHCRFTKNRKIINRQSFRIRAGEYDLKINEGSEQKGLEIINIINHPEYNSDTHENDIAVWEIKTSFEFNEYVQPGILPYVDYIPTGMARVAGWGDLGNGTHSTNLREIWIPIVSNEECSRVFESVGEKKVTSKMLCAGEKMKDVCEGDSGGPLMCPYKEDMVQCGIVSFGFPCDHNNGIYLSAYTRVSKYADWIRANAQISSTCGEHFTASYGEIRFFHYSDNINCKWRISSNNPKNQILITFGERFELEENDFLTARDTDTGIELFKLTGNKNGTGIGNFKTLGNSLNLIFESDTMINGFGFKLIYKFITTDCRQTIKSKTGQIQHLNYGENEVCEWIIIPDDRYALLEIKFDAQFGLEKDCDFLRVFNLQTNKEILTLTGSSPPKKKTYLAFPHKFVFTSDSSNNGHGFSLYYKFSHLNEVFDTTTTTTTTMRTTTRTTRTPYRRKPTTEEWLSLGFTCGDGANWSCWGDEGMRDRSLGRYSEKCEFTKQIAGLFKIKCYCNYLDEDNRPVFCNA